MDPGPRTPTAPGSLSHLKIQGHGKEQSQQDQEQGLLTAATGGARLTKAAHCIFGARVSRTVGAGWGAAVTGQAGRHSESQCPPHHRHRC